MTFMPSRASNLINLSVGLTSTQVLGSSPRRKALYLSPSPVNRITISFGRPAVLDQGDVQLYPGQRPYVVSEDTHGSIVHDAVFAITTGGAQQLTGSEELMLP